MTAAVARTAETIRSVLRNALALLGAYALPRVLTLGAIVVAARSFGAGQFGNYGTAAGLAVLVSIFATLGMAPLLTREIARAPERASELIRVAHRIKSASNLFMLVVLYVAVRWVLGYSDAVQSCALLLGLAYAVGAYCENFAAYYQAVERMHVWTQASALFGLVTGGLGALFAYQTRSIIWFSSAPLAGQLVCLLYLRLRLPAEMSAPGGAKPVPASELLRSLAPFAAAFVALTIYSKIDVLLLTEWSSPVQVGLYTAAYKFVDIVQALTIVAAAAVYPRLARITDLNDGERWAGTRLIEIVLVAVSAGAGALWLLRGPIVHLLFGSEYAGSVPALGFLAAALPSLGVNIAAAYVLSVRGRMRDVAIAYSVAAAVNILLNWVLAPQFAATGTAAAKLGSETMLSVGMLVLLHRAAAAAPARAVFMAFAGSAAVCAALVLLPDPTHGWLRAPAFLLLAAILFARGGALPHHELAALRHLVRRRASRLGLAETGTP